MANDRLEQLLDAWMIDRERGVSRTLAELCESCPDLLPELSRRIQVLSRFEQLADIDQSETLASQIDVDTSQQTKSPFNSAKKRVALPTAIGNFKPLELLGEGGMGAVFLAEDSQLGRRVAVKVMKAELAANADSKQRFLREARAMATIEHENIMTIYAVGEDQGIPFLVMPVLKGETLDDRLHRERHLPVAECCRIGREIAAGLSAAHSHRLIHRDIKPRNIWLEGSHGKVRILDFGLARPASDDHKLTHSGTILGTPAYMAPEQAAGLEATPRSDLFSLGAVLYRMTTGLQPFAGSSMIATLSNLANRTPDSPKKLNPELPESLSNLIDQLLSKDPNARPESAEDVLDSLRIVEPDAMTRASFDKPKSVAPKMERKPEQPASRALPTPAHTVGSNQLPRRRVLVGGGLAGIALLFAIIVYRIQTDQGTLILTIDDQQVEAKLNQAGLDIEDAKTGRIWHLTPNKPETMPSGDYKLPKLDGLLLKVTDDDGTEFTTAEFKIKRGDKTTVSVILQPNSATATINTDSVANNDDSKHMTIPGEQSIFDKFDSSQIPIAERLDYLPKDVVAVFGTHRQKTWGSPLYINHGALSYSPDGKWICACDCSNIYLFDAITFDLRKQIPNGLHFLSYRPFAFSNNSTRLYLGKCSLPHISAGAMVDLADPALPIQVQHEFGNSYVIADSPSENYVATIEAEVALKVGPRERDSGHLLPPSTVHDLDGLPKQTDMGTIREMVFSPDGKWLITGHWPGGYRVHRKQDNKFLPVAVIPSQMPTYNARVVYSFTPEHQRALLLGADVCHLIDLSTEQPSELPVPEELNGVFDLSVSRDGSRLAATKNVLGTTSQIWIGNWVDGRPKIVNRFDAPGVSLGLIALSPDAKSVACISGAHGLSVYDLTTNPPAKQTTQRTSYTGIASNGAVALTVGTDGKVLLESLQGASPTFLDSVQIDRASIEGFISAEGDRAVTTTRPDLYTPWRSQVYIWDLANGKLKQSAKQFEGTEDRHWAWASLFSNGTRFLLGNQIWDVSSKTPSVLIEYSQVPPSPSVCEVSRDGQLVAFGTADKLSVFRTQGKVDQPVASGQVPTQPASLSFSPDAKRIAGSFAGGICMIWDVVDGRYVESLRMPSQLEFAPHQVPYHLISTVFSRDGQRVYFSGWGGVGEWTLEGNKVTRFWPLPGYASLSIADDDRHLILSNSNCTTWILRLKTQ